MTIEDEFQSALPVAGERSVARVAPAEGQRGFNPRSPLPGSEASIRVKCDGMTLFQSALPVAGERSDQALFRFHGQIQFQSALPVAGERSQRAPLLSRYALSFNPRSPLPGSEATPRHQPPRPRASFNPRSPLPGSEAAFTGDGYVLARVSIRAPRCRGAKRLIMPLPIKDPEVSIRAPRCRGAKL